jgi:putative mRNA 3-end processing factor
LEAPGTSDREEKATVNETLALTDAGLYCAAGDFYVDPWLPVPRAVITHAHGDHAHAANLAYLTAADGLPLLRSRLGFEATIDTMRYGEIRRVGAVDVSFHPAGHILGSAQIRIAHQGRVTVVSGDYKLAPDGTCAPFEPIRCDTFLTESTFGLPIYRWDDSATTIRGIVSWWERNRSDKRASVLFAYALGKAQRILIGLIEAVSQLPGPIFCHGAVERINAVYREAGINLPLTMAVAEAPAETRWQEALIIAPPIAQGSGWMNRFEPYRTGFASGWMAIRGTRRRRNLDRGFLLSDHADWDALNRAIEATGAPEIWVTHGYRDELARWLNERGRTARGLETRFEGEAGAGAPELAEPPVDLPSSSV